MLHSIIKGLPGNVSHFFSNPSIIPLQNSPAQDMDINISLLRLDEMHPFISGNKIFKLVYFLREALQSGSKRIVTYGGAYSNHLAATAYAGKLFGIECFGLVRGEQPAQLSETLLFCRQQGMQLTFIPRHQYKITASLEKQPELTRQFGNHALVPEGGFSKMGAEGAALINDYIPEDTYSHICLGVGTATTLAGILYKKYAATTILGFSALKGLHDVSERLGKCGICNTQNLEMVNQFHFGGFGKQSPVLVDFMNQFYDTHLIPLDKVYTSKMMFGVFDLLAKKKFPAEARILCIHTGGLQGNVTIREQLHQPSPGIYSNDIRDE